MKDQQKEMIDWMEHVLQPEERSHLLKETTPSTNPTIETLKKYIMNEKSDPSKPDKRSDLERLPEFWRALVLAKESFPDEKDYHASIRVLCLLQKFISDVLSPYIKASLIATKRSGEMQALEREIHADVFDGLGSDKGKGSLLERALGFPSPDDYVDFPGIAAEIRTWREHRPIVRCLLLLGLVDRLDGHLSFKQWLQDPNILLRGDSPLALIERGEWSALADYLDDSFIGDS